MEVRVLARESRKVNKVSITMGHFMNQFLAFEVNYCSCTV